MINNVNVFSNLPYKNRILIRLGTHSDNDKTKFGANFQKYRLSVYTFLNIRSRVGDKHFESNCSIKSYIPNNATQTNVWNSFFGLLKTDIHFNYGMSEKRCYFLVKLNWLNIKITSFWTNRYITFHKWKRQKRFFIEKSLL